MGKLKEKIATLQDQINFISAGLDLLKDDGRIQKDEIEVVWTMSDARIMQAILENLNIIKAWINLPDYHQAALHLLDAAMVQKSFLNVGGDGNMTLDDFFGEIRKLMHRNDASLFDDIAQQHELMMRIGAFALLAIGQFIVPYKPSSKFPDTIRKGSSVMVLLDHGSKTEWVDGYIKDALPNGFLVTTYNGSSIVVTDPLKISVSKEVSNG